MPIGSTLIPPLPLMPLLQFWLLLAAWLTPDEVPCVTLVPEDEPFVSATLWALPFI